MTRKKLLIIASIIIFLFLFFILKNDHSKTAPNIHGLVIPEPKIIAPFSLKGTKDKAITEQTLKSKWSLLFFGYTFCPDICPMTLSTLQKTWQLLEEKGDTKDIQIIFISLDPKRDSIKRVKEYVEYFNQNFLGATGSEEQIASLSQQLGIPYFRQTAKNGEYIIDHGSMIIVTNPHGEYQAVLTSPHKPEAITEDLKAIKNYF